MFMMISVSILLVFYQNILQIVLSCHNIYAFTIITRTNYSFDYKFVGVRRRSSSIQLLPQKEGQSYRSYPPLSSQFQQGRNLSIILTQPNKKSLHILSNSPDNNVNDTVNHQSQQHQQQLGKFEPLVFNPTPNNSQQQPQIIRQQERIVQLYDFSSQDLYKDGIPYVEMWDFQKQLVDGHLHRLSSNSASIVTTSTSSSTAFVSNAFLTLNTSMNTNSSSIITTNQQDDGTTITTTTTTTTSQCDSLQVSFFSSNHKSDNNNNNSTNVLQYHTSSSLSSTSSTISTKSGYDSIIMLQHTPVYTLGTASDTSFIKTESSSLSDPIEIVRIERGGEVTYHGPGQLVVYPILDLRGYKQDIHWYVRALEEAILMTLHKVGVKEARREDGLTGIFVQNRKIASIGVKVRRWVTMHGLAVNVDSRSLENFNGIEPCGLVGRKVCCVNDFLDVPMSVHQFSQELVTSLEEVFQIHIV